jgi:hypothetical protein
LTGVTAQTEYAAGRAQKWLPNTRSSGKVFNCFDFPETSVKMTVWDQKLNYDFCVVTLQLADNQGACGNGLTGTVTGNISTPTGQMLNGATTILTNMLPEMVRAATTNNNGVYTFSNVQHSQDYEIQSVKNDDYTNGVSTLDLVLIQRHILGINQLNDGYKIVAADINKDDKINSTDLVELRKLILGIYDEFPSNGSWRFVDAKQQFANANFPWPINEKLFIQNMTNDMNNMNFISVKIGDVNGSASANAQDGNVDTRSAFTLNVDEKSFEQNETAMIPLFVDNTTEVHGFQFTMDLRHAELVNIYVNGSPVDASNIAKLGQNLYTVSWNSLTPVEDQQILTLEIKALQKGKLSDMIRIHSDVTKAEIYNGKTLESNKLSLKFVGGSNDQFALYQNEPNPFQDITNIQFNLPEAGEATLTILDVTGKLIYKKSGNFEKGMNSFQISKADLNQTGVMIYKVESGQYAATAKMIGLE